MNTEHPTSHVAEGDSAFVDRLRSFGMTNEMRGQQSQGADNALVDRARSLGLIGKAPETSSATVTPADPFGRAPPPPPGFVEVPAPAGTRVDPGAPRTRHFRADGTAKMRTRVISGAILRPDPAA